MLPGRTGFDVLRTMRAEGGPGPAVILLTARDDVIDRVAGLELGADDYVTKPFEPRELVARVGAVLRRVRTAEAPADPGDTNEPVRILDLAVDPLAREVRPRRHAGRPDTVRVRPAPSRSPSSPIAPGPASSSAPGSTARRSTRSTAPSTAT